MCWTQAKSPLESVGRPAKARPQGSLSQISRPHCSSENGGLATTTSNVASPPEPYVVDDLAADAATRVTLARALAMLTRRQRAVLVLRYYEDLPEAEVARILGCSVGTVRSQTARTLARHPRATKAINNQPDAAMRA